MSPLVQQLLYRGGLYGLANSSKSRRGKLYDSSALISPSLTVVPSLTTPLGMRKGRCRKRGCKRYVYVVGRGDGRCRGKEFETVGAKLVNDGFGVDPAHLVKAAGRSAVDS